MLIREVVYQDYPQIRNLVKKHKLEIYDQSDWEAIWKNNPYLNKKKKKWSPGWVLEANGTIVGHVGNIPVEYYYKSKPYIGSIISCWVVEEKYRYLSMKLLQKFNSQKNLDFAIGTTSNIKTAKALSFFGWKKNPMKEYNEKLYIILNLKSIIKSYFKKKKIYTNNFLTYFFYIILNFILYRKLNYWKKIKTNKEVVVYNNFNEKFDLFWNKLQQTNKDVFIFNRSKNWMNWHLNHHLKNNEAWIVAEEINNEIKGYCVCLAKNNREIDLKKIVLIDFISLDNNHDTLLNLLTHSVNIASKKDFYLFEIVGFNYKKREIIKKIKPFLRKAPFCPFYFHTNKLELTEDLQKEKYWDSSILDGDSII